MDGMRRAVPADAAELAALNMRIWQQVYPGIVPQSFLDRLDIAHFRQFWDRHLAGSGISLLTTDADGRITGFAAAGPPDPPQNGFRWEIYRLYVDPAHHGRGLGSRLFDAVRQEVELRGNGGLLLWVFEENRTARTFYERKGGSPLRRQCFHAFDGAAMWEIAYVWMNRS